MLRTTPVRIWLVVAHWLAMLAFVCGSGLAMAQDVVVAPLAWVDPDDPPQQLPVRARELRPEFPRELLKTPDIGWATQELSIDGKGKVRPGGIHATLPPFGRALERAEEAAGRFKPGRRDGRAVNTRVRVTAIFNPASSSSASPDSTVRLLDAAPIVDPRRWPGGAAGPDQEQVVWATVQVSRDGQPTAVSHAPKEVKELLETAVRTWRFVPARRGGEPVDSEVALPFILVPPEPTSPPNGTLPKVRRTVPPIYPLGLRQSGIRGEVTLEFVVDIEGRVRNPIVVRSLHPGFNASAIEAVKKWEFEPAQVDGRPVNVLMQQSIRFELAGETDGGRDGIDVRRRGQPDKLPPELRYDTPPRQQSMVLPRYPYSQLRDKKSGSAEVALLIDPRGRVIATKVTTASHPDFGLALQAAAQEFTYEPALREGRPTLAMIGFEHRFRFADPVQVPEHDKNALMLEQRSPERILKATSLDHPVRPRRSNAPRFPAGVREDVLTGEAMVEMLIDGEGRVCVPRVVSATQPEFGYAAAHAVTEWRFDPPTSQGKPGTVRVVVPFSFKRPPTPAADTSGSDEPQP